MSCDPAFQRLNSLRGESLVIGVRGTATLVARINKLRGTLSTSLFCKRAIQHFCDAVDADDLGAIQRLRAAEETPNTLTRSSKGRRRTSSKSTPTVILTRATQRS